MIELTETDWQLLRGERGQAPALALRILVRSAALMGASRLLNIEGAHIDGCLYHGQASLDFVERLVRDGGKVMVPTTLNVGSLDLMHPELFRGDKALQSQARRLMDAHLALGCESSFTCAPYQLKNGPRPGQQLAWAESKAIVFANSVLGARTNRYGDFIDLCAALTGRAPDCGLHVAENRYGQLFFALADFPSGRGSRDIWYAALGLLVGQRAGGLIPVITGLPPDTSEDELKALGAAAASSGALAATVVVTRDALKSTRAALNRARAGDSLVAVSVGTPHFSLAEFATLEHELDAAPGPLRVDFYVNTSRFILWQLEASGAAQRLMRGGV